MTKIDIFSGFLGAGKTTLIQKLIREAYAGEKLVLIENEFGEIGIDGGFMKEAGIEIAEMNSGCICCSLVGDFTEALGRVLEEFQPDRILIEPSGVGKLSDVIKAVQKVESDTVKLNSFTTVADATKCRIYAKNFGEFYNDQIQHAECIILSRTDGMAEEKLVQAVNLLREKNESATIITTPWPQLTGTSILQAMEGSRTLRQDLELLSETVCPVCGHDHEHHHHHDGKCDCHDHEHHHHHHDEECGCHDHEHHHHHHDGECDCHDHEHHHHHHDGECDCHDHEHHHHHHDGECDCDDHEHHHHHLADDVFDSWGVETVVCYSADEIAFILDQLNDESTYGSVLRAKGIVSSDGEQWIHFDYVPGEPDIRLGGADVIGRLCVIGSHIDKAAISKLFRIG